MQTAERAENAEKDKNDPPHATHLTCCHHFPANAR
jgi:hypothetical protein